MFVFFSSTASEDIDSDLLKEQIRTLLVDISNQTMVNFPKINVNANENEIIASIRFIDHFSPLAFFEKLDKFSKIKFKANPENPINVNSSVECATACLKSEKSV